MAYYGPIMLAELMNAFFAKGKSFLNPKSGKAAMGH